MSKSSKRDRRATADVRVPVMAATAPLERSVAMVGITSRTIVGGLLVAALAQFVLLASPWFYGQIYLGGDLLSFNLPTRKFYADCLAHGDSPLWWPSVYCGFFLHGDGQTGIFHPWHWGLYRLLSLLDAFTLELLANYLVMFGGLVVLLRRLGLPIMAALWGGVLFAFSAFNVVHVDHPNVLATMAHVPWLLWTIDVLLSSTILRHLAVAQLAIALLTGSQFLLGHPQSMWFTLLTEGWYVLARFTSVVDRRRLVSLIVALALGLVIGTVQWLPTWDQLAQSNRAGASEKFRSTGSMHPLHMVEYLAPYLFEDRIPPSGQPVAGREWSGAYELYAGMLIPVAVVWLAMRFRALGTLRWLALAAAVLTVMGLALASGRFLPPLHWLMLKIPVVGLFRSSYHYISVISIGVAVLGAVALADVWHVATADQPVPWPRLAWLLVVPVVVVVVVGISMFQPHPVVSGVTWQPAGWPSISVCLLLAFLATGLTMVAARGYPVAVAALLLFALVDQFAYTLKLQRSMPQLPLADLVKPLPIQLRDPQWRVWIDPRYPKQNLLALQGGRQPSGYVALAPQFRLIDDPELTRHHPQIIARLTSTRWRLQYRPPEVKDALPRARMVGQIRTAKDLVQEIVDVDLAQVALIDESIDLPSTEPGRVTFISDRPGRSLLAVSARAPQTVVFSESWHPGWQVSVNSEPATVLRAYGDFMACQVPAGDSEVEFRFLSVSTRRGAYVSTAGLLAAITLFAIGMFRHRS